MYTSHMKRHMELRRWVGIVAISLLASGCLVRVAYENADRLMLWEIDRYFDLTSAQSDATLDRLRAHLHWHRAQELDTTIALLRRVQQRAADNVTADEVQETFTEFDTLRRTLVERLAPDSVALFAQLNDAQITHLEEALSEANREWEERAALPPERRGKERTKRLLQVVEDWVGPLEESQEQALTRASAALPDTLDVWLAYRIERQQQFIHLVRAAREVPDAITTVLDDWIMVPAPEPFKTQRGAVREFILAVDRTMTFKQRAHFIELLQEWIDDLENAKANRSAPR